MRKTGVKCALRRSSGQAIVEGTVMAVVLTLLSVGLLLMIFNTTVLGNYQLKLQMVATETAKQINQQRYWLGMERPHGTEAGQWDKDTCNRNAAIAAGYMAQAVGLIAPDVDPETKVDIGEPQEVEMTIGNDTVTLTQVTVKIKDLPLFTGGTNYIPSSISLQAVGMACDASASPGGVAILHFMDPAHPNMSKAIRIPAYCATYQNPALNPRPNISQANRTPWLKPGKWQGRFPVCYAGAINTSLENADIYVQGYQGGDAGGGAQVQTVETKTEGTKW